MSLSQRFTLDQSSFEKFLAAAWVLQCVHDQLHQPAVEPHETIAELVKPEKAVEKANPSLQPLTEPLAFLSPTMTPADSEPKRLNRRPDRLAASLPSPASTSADDVKLTMLDPENGRPAEAVAVQSISIPVVSKLDDKEPELHRPTQNTRISLGRAPGIFSNLQPIVRIHLTLRALRAAIATPVLLLAMVAGMLLLEASRNEPFHNAQATSNLGTSDDPNKRIENAGLRQSRPVSPLEVSHMNSTDPSTSSVVQALSRYEIRGLRRQAKYGDASAAFILGTAFETGRYLRQDCTEAARWVAIAAEGGNAPAQYNLGLRYRDGDGVPVNRTESAKWLRKASASRHSRARIALELLASR